MRNLAISIFLGFALTGTLSAQNLDGTGTPAAKPPEVRQKIPYAELKALMERVLPVHTMKQPPLPQSVQLLFNVPGYNGKIEDFIVDQINKAKSEVLFDQYAVTSQKIADALVAAHARKCTVVGIIDPSPNIDRYSAPSYFITNNIAIFYGAANTINYNKYCIIDRSTIITGSYDWTNSATTGSQNIIVVEDPAVVIAYYNAFIAQLTSCDVPKAVADLINQQTADAPSAPTTSQMPVDNTQSTTQQVAPH